MSGSLARGRVLALGLLLCATFLPGAAMAQEASDSTAESPETRIDEDAAGNPYVAGELIVTYEEHASGEAAQTANREAGALLEENLPDIDTAVLSVPEVKRRTGRSGRETSIARSASSRRTRASSP